MCLSSVFILPSDALWWFLIKVICYWLIPGVDVLLLIMNFWTQNSSLNYRNWYEERLRGVEAGIHKMTWVGIWERTKNGPQTSQSSCFLSSPPLCPYTEGWVHKVEQHQPPGRLKLRFYWAPGVFSRNPLFPAPNWSCCRIHIRQSFLQHSCSQFLPFIGQKGWEWGWDS